MSNGNDLIKRAGTPTIDRASSRILRKLQQGRFAAPLTVERFDSPLPKLPKFANLGDGGGIINATIPILGASVANILDIPLSAAEGTINSFIQLLGFGETEQIIKGVTSAGSRTRDITDPSIPLSAFREQGIEIDEDELRARNFKRFLIAGGLGVVNAGRGGIEKGYEDGALSAPEDERERVADFAGQLLADMGITLPFIGPLSLLSKAAVTATGRTAVGRGVSRAAGALVGGRKAFPIVEAARGVRPRPGVPVFPFPGFSGAAGALTRGFRPLREVVSDKYGVDVATKVMERTTQLLTNFGVDVGIGFALGGVHTANALANGEDLSPEEIAQRVAWYTLFGVGAGALVQGFHASGLSRSLPRLQNMILSGPFEKLPIGTRIGDLELVGPRVVKRRVKDVKRGRARGVPLRGDDKIVGKAPPTAEGRQGALWRNAETGEFAKPPDVGALAAHILATVKAVQDEHATAPKIDGVEPAPLGLDARAQEVQTLAAAWMPTVRARASQISPVELRSELVTLARQQLDPGIPAELRVSMLGRARAIQEVLGEAEPQAGVVSLATEEAAIQTVMNESVEAAIRAAARHEASGNRALQQRILSLVEQDLPKKRSLEVNRLVSEGEATTNRGLVEGNRVRLEDGSQWVLLEDPALGVVNAKLIRSAGQNRGAPIVVKPIALHDVILRPEAGGTAALRDGTIVEILEATGGNTRTIRGRTARGEEVTVPFADVLELSNNPRAAAAHQRAMEIERGPSVKGATAVEPVIVATPEGEVGTLVAQGPEGSVVRMRDGTERVVEKVVKTKETAGDLEIPPASVIERRQTSGEGPGGVERRTRQELVEAGAESFRQVTRERARARQSGVAKEIKTFVPGTRPEADAHILFFALPKDKVGAFEIAYRSEGRLDSHLTGGVHVLPPVEPGQGVALFAVELPQSVLPNTAYKGGARRARDAIAGKAVKLESYESRVTLDPAEVGRAPIFKVPEGLHAKAMRSEAEFTKLRGKDRQEYLRRLLDFSDDVTSEVAQASTRRRVAGEQKIKAQQANDGRVVVAARTEGARATVDVTKALTTQAVDASEVQLQGVLKKLVAESPAMNETLQRGLAGDQEIIRAFATEHLAAGEEVLLLHGTSPGKTMGLRVEGERVVLEVGQGAERQVVSEAATVGEALQQAQAAGFSGGLHQRATPGEFVMDGNPWVRAAVDDKGAMRIYQAARLQGSDEVVWQMVGSRGVGEGGLELLGFVSDAPSVKLVRSSNQAPETVGVVSAEGTTTHLFDVVDPSRGTVANATVTYNPVTKKLIIEDIFGSGAGAIGPRGIRELQRQLVAEFPEAEIISGLRTTGVRRRAVKAAGTLQELEAAGRLELPIRRKSVIPPPWEVGPITEGAAPLYNSTIGKQYRPRGSEVMEDAQAALARQAELSEWAPVSAQLAAGGLTEVPGTAVFARLLPEGQPARVTAAPLDKASVTVELADGSIREVARSQVRLSKVNSPDARDFRIAQDAHNGGAAYDNALTAKSGLGKLERELGLFGSNRPSIIRERGLARAQEHIDQLSIKDGEMLGDPATVQKLIELHDRSVDLGFSKDVLDLLPAEAREMFVEASYQHARRQISDESYSLLFAGAKYDKLVPKQVELLRQIGRENNLNPNLPIHRVAEDLWNKRVIDPMAAQWTLSYRQELGAVRTSLETNLSPDAVELIRRPARGRSWWLSRGLNPSHYELARHPVMQAFESAVRHAMEVGQQSLRDLESFGLRWQRQQKLDFDGVLRKVKNEDWFLVRDLIEKHGTWDNAVEAKAIKANDPRHLMFSELVERLERSKNRHIRQQLRMGTEALQFSKLSREAQEEFLASHPWVAATREELLELDYFILPSTLQKFKSDGLNVRKGIRTEEEIEEFMALLLRHESSEALPAGIGGEKQWMHDQFDLWKRFGRENYWPRIHEGEFALQIQSATGWKNVGFGSSYQDTALLYRQLRQRGDFGVSPFRVVHKKTYADDILQETLSSGELFTWVNSLKDALIADEETLAGLFVPFAGKRPPSPVLRKPVTGSLGERIGDLKPPVRHPWKELQIYERRLARQEQRFTTAQAYKTFLDKQSKSARELDGALARAEGLEPLFGESNNQLNK